MVRHHLKNGSYEPLSNKIQIIIITGIFTHTYARIPKDLQKTHFYFNHIYMDPHVLLPYTQFYIITVKIKASSYLLATVLLWYQDQLDLKQKEKKRKKLNKSNFKAKQYIISNDVNNG